MYLFGGGVDHNHINAYGVVIDPKELENKLLKPGQSHAYITDNLEDLSDKIFIETKCRLNYAVDGYERYAPFFIYVEDSVDADTDESRKLSFAEVMSYGGAIPGFQLGGGGTCSTCGSPGTNKSTCPCNPKAKNKVPSKHPLCNFTPIVAKASPKPQPKSVKVKRTSSTHKCQKAIDYFHDILGKKYKWVQQDFEWLS